MNKSKRATLIIFAIMMVFFLLFLVFPLVRLFTQAVTTDAGLSFTLLIDILTSTQLQQSFIGSFTISLKASVIATIIGKVKAICHNKTNDRRNHTCF